MSELARRYAQALWQVSPDGEALERTARALMEAVSYTHLTLPTKLEV